MEKTNRKPIFALIGAIIVVTTTFAPASGAGPIDWTIPGNFGRMFHLLLPFALPSDGVRAALIELGKPGGILDANDNLDAGPVQLILDPNLSLINRNNPTHTAGNTFMGQFLDHDMSFDMTSTLGVFTPPITTPNARTPIFDLDSVYGNGPEGSPEFYDPDDPAKFLVESGGLFEDLPRDSENVAIISDPRNDENLILAGLHAAFLLFHNNAVDLVRSENPSISDADAFKAARRITIFHYQWLIFDSGGVKMHQNRRDKNAWSFW